MSHVDTFLLVHRIAALLSADVPASSALEDYPTLSADHVALCGACAAADPETGVCGEGGNGSCGSERA